MAKPTPTNMDGFIVRRRASGNDRRLGLDDLRVPNKYLINPEHKSGSDISQSPVHIITADGTSIQPMQTAEHIKKQSHRGNGIDMTLSDVAIPTKPVSGRGFRLRKPSKRLVKLFATMILLIGVIYAGFFAWKIISNGGKIFNGNPFAAIFGNKELKKDQYGRTNVLIFGTSEDDANHDGAYLTDSIMIASFDGTKKDAYLLSVPRDLWVNYGQACISGYQGKVNVTYICNANTMSNGKPKDESAGQTGLRNQLSKIFGIDLQYSVHVNYTVLEKAVDAVGGITIKIDSTDPRGVLDRNFDWKCPNGGRSQSCYNVKYPNGPANLDGLHALYLARARGDDPLGRTYGLGGSNFEREKYQQKILIAIKEKATSAGTLANPVAVTNLFDALGENVRTNIDTEEMKSFISLAKDVDTTKIKTLTLVDSAKPLVMTGDTSGQSIVRPVAGLFDYSAIQNYIKINISGDQSAREAASVAEIGRAHV